MAAATIPAIFSSRSARASSAMPPLTSATVHRAATIARREPALGSDNRTPGPERRHAGLQQMQSDLQQSKEERLTEAPMTPEEPESPARSQLQGNREAVVAEQKALADLAARCLAGDAQAWEHLARTQHRRIYSICYRFTGSQSDAEDLTQEAFLKMYRNLSSFDPTKGGFTTWLTTLTRNLLVDNYRRSRMERVSDSLDESYDNEGDGPTKADRLADGGKNQEQHVAGLELRAQIQEALRQVSPDLREAVILRDLEDMDYKDIAEILGVPQGTVKSRISRGRSELARLLKRIEGQVM